MLRRSRRIHEFDYSLFSTRECLRRKIGVGGFVSGIKVSNFHAGNWQEPYPAARGINKFFSCRSTKALAELMTRSSGHTALPLSTPEVREIIGPTTCNVPGPPMKASRIDTAEFKPRLAGSGHRQAVCGPGCGLGVRRNLLHRWRAAGFAVP